MTVTGVIATGVAGYFTWGDGGWKTWVEAKRGIPCLEHPDPNHTTYLFLLRCVSRQLVNYSRMTRA